MRPTRGPGLLSPSQGASITNQKGGSPTPSPSSQRRLSWLAPHATGFSGGLALGCLRDEFKRAMGEADPIESVSTLLSRVWAQRPDVSCALLLVGGRWVVASQSDAASGAMVCWRAAVAPRRREEGPLPPLVRTLSPTPHGLRPMARDVLGGWLCQQRRGEAGEEERGDDASGDRWVAGERWVLSHSSEVVRASSILLGGRHPGCVGGFVPSYARVSPSGAAPTVKGARWARMDEAARDDLEERTRLLGDVAGVPVASRRGEVVVDPSLRDPWVKARLRELGAYVVARRVSSPDEARVFRELVERVRVEGPSPATLDTLARCWRGIKGVEEKGCRLRLGAFLPTPGLFLQYSHYSKSSRECGWLPLKFGEVGGRPNLLACPGLDPDEFGERVLGMPLALLRPRILCLLIHRGGRKVCSGRIVDLANLGKPGKAWAWHLPLRTEFERWPSRYMREAEEHGERQGEPVTPLPCLPVALMEALDRRREGGQWLPGGARGQIEPKAPTPQQQGTPMPPKTPGRGTGASPGLARMGGGDKRGWNGVSAPYSSPTLAKYGPPRRLPTSPRDPRVSPDGGMGLERGRDGSRWKPPVPQSPNNPPDGEDESREVEGKTPTPPSKAVPLPSEEAKDKGRSKERGEESEREKEEEGRNAGEETRGSRGGNSNTPSSPTQQPSPQTSPISSKLSSLLSSSFSRLGETPQAKTPTHTPRDGEAGGREEQPERQDAQRPPSDTPPEACGEAEMRQVGEGEAPIESLVPPKPPLIHPQAQQQGEIQQEQLLDTPPLLAGVSAIALSPPGGNIPYSSKGRRTRNEKAEGKGPAYPHRIVPLPSEEAMDKEGGNREDREEQEAEAPLRTAPLHQEAMGRRGREIGRRSEGEESGSGERMEEERSPTAPSTQMLESNKLLSSLFTLSSSSSKSPTHTPTGGEAGGREDHLGTIDITPDPPSGIAHQGQRVPGEGRGEGAGQGREMREDNIDENLSTTPSLTLPDTPTPLLEGSLHQQPPQRKRRRRRGRSERKREKRKRQQQMPPLFSSNTPPVLLGVPLHPPCPEGVEAEDRESGKGEGEPKTLGVQGALSWNAPQLRDMKEGVAGSCGMERKGLSQEPLGVGDQAPKEARGLDAQSGMEAGRRGGGKKPAPWVEVKESESRLTLIIHLGGLKMKERQLDIKVVPEGSRNTTRPTNGSCDVTKPPDNLDVYSFSSFSSSYPATTCGHSGQVGGKASRSVGREPANIFVRSGAPGGKGHDPTPLLPRLETTSEKAAGKGAEVQRKGSLDLYHTGRRTEERKVVAVPSPPQWYDQEWYHVYDEKDWYHSEGPPVRAISQRLREKFVTALDRSQASVHPRMWLNLPRFLASPVQREMQALCSHGEKDEVSAEHLAVSQFYRGMWGKAYRTLTGRQKEESCVPEAEIERLFPHVECGLEVDLGALASEEQPAGGTITAEMVGKAVSALPNGKGCGLSGCTYEVLKRVASAKRGREALTAFYNHALLTPESLHPQLFTSRCVGIRKKDGGIRPLCLQEVLLKPLHKLLASRVNSCVLAGLGGTQKCLSPREGQKEAFLRVMGNLRAGPKGVSMIQFDYSNAFGTVSRRHIIQRLEHYKVPPLYVRYIAHMLSRQQVEYRGPGGDIRLRRIETGVPQGEPLSMFLFALGIDELVKDFDSIPGVAVTAYADDLVLVVENDEDLPYIIKAFVDESKQRGLRVNMKKTRVGYTQPLCEETKRKLDKWGVEALDINTSALEYVGLPVTLSERVQEGIVKEKTEAFVAETEALWRKRVPLQMKYHLQELCLNSKLVFLFRSLPLPSKGHSGWMGLLQKRLDALWQSQLGVIPAPYRRIPVRMYGAGLFHIPDRRKIAQLLVHSEREAGASEAVQDPALGYYTAKVSRWADRGLVGCYDLANIPPRANVSLSSPPSDQSMRLDDPAFRLLWATRYCSSVMDLAQGTESPHWCPIHQKPWTLQHILGCPLSAMQAVRVQHDRLVGYVCGILLRSPAVSEVHKERKTVAQEEREREGLQPKRADIVYVSGGKQQSIDVSVTTSWSSNQHQNPLVAAQRRKEREYDGEKVHVLLFDTSGLLTAEGWELLRAYGACGEDLRRMQAIIHNASARRYETIVNSSKNRAFRSERLEARGRGAKENSDPEVHEGVRGGGEKQK